MRLPSGMCLSIGNPQQCTILLSAHGDDVSRALLNACREKTSLQSGLRLSCASSRTRGEKGEISNYPKQHSANLTAKHQADGPGPQKYAEQTGGGWRTRLCERSVGEWPPEH